MKSIHKIGLWAIAMLLPWVATATPNEATDSVKSAVPMSRMTVSQSSTKPQGILLQGVVTDTDDFPLLNLKADIIHRAIGSVVFDQMLNFNHG